MLIHDAPCWQHSDYRTDRQPTVDRNLRLFCCPRGSLATLYKIHLRTHTHARTPPHDVLLSTEHIVLTWWTDRDIRVMWLTLSINFVRARCLIICSAFNVCVFFSVFRWAGSRGRCRPTQIQGTWLSYVITREKSCRWLL